MLDEKMDEKEAQNKAIGSVEEAKILWGLIQEHWHQGRHLDAQRLHMSRLIIAVAAGVVAVVGFNGLSADDLPMTSFLALLGMFGVFFSKKYDDLFYSHMHLARTYRQKLEPYVPDTSFKQGVDDANVRIGKSLPLRSKPRLKHFWMALHSFIAIFGVLLTVLALNTSPGAMLDNSSNKANPADAPKARAAD